MFRENTSIMVAGILSLIVIVHSLYKRFGLSITLALSYFFGNAIWQYVFNYSIMTRKNATTWLLESLVLLVFFKLLTDNKRILKDGVYYWLLMAFVAASSIYYFFTGYGLIDASSFEAGMLIFTILMPITFKTETYQKYYLFLLLLVGLYIGGSTGLALLVCWIFGFIFNRNRLHLKIASVLVFITGLVYAYKYTSLLNDSGRFEIWKTYLDFWHSKFNMLIGSGIGSFKNISPHLQTAHGTLVYAHNDFLEIYLETGIVGLVASAYLIFKLSIEAIKERLLHTVVMMCVFSLNYFPMQVMLTKLLFVLAIATILNKSGWFKKHEAKYKL